MKFIIKKNYFVFLLFVVLLFSSKTFAKDSKIQYSKENISNYFQGKLSINQNYNRKAFDNLKKVRSLKNYHSQFNVEFIRTLILLEKFEEAFDYSKTIWIEEEFFYETDLLLGVNYILNEDYKSAEKYFKRLNKISRYNLIFDNFIGNDVIKI